MKSIVTDILKVLTRWANINRNEKINHISELGYNLPELANMSIIEIGKREVHLNVLEGRGSNPGAGIHMMGVF